MPGVTYLDHGARADAILPGQIDRGGVINLIAPDRTISKNCVGQAASGFLVDVQKVTDSEMEEWNKLYPDAFNREYNESSGLCFDAWVEGGK